MSWGLADVLSENPEEVLTLKLPIYFASGAPLHRFSDLLFKYRICTIIATFMSPLIGVTQACKSGTESRRVLREAHALCLMQAALEILDQSISKAPLAIAAAKRAIDDGFEVPLLKGLAFERAHYTQLFASEDRLEALRAFAEKRRPSFKGC